MNRRTFHIPLSNGNVLVVSKSLGDKFVKESKAARSNRKMKRPILRKLQKMAGMR